MKILDSYSIRIVRQISCCALNSLRTTSIHTTATGFARSFTCTCIILKRCTRNDISILPSVLWLGGRKGIRPVETEWWGAGVVICLERGADLHIAQLMQLPLTVSCFSKIQIGLTFLVPAHLGSPGKRAVKRVCVCYENTIFLHGKLIFGIAYQTMLLMLILLTSLKHA